MNLLKWRMFSSEETQKFGTSGRLVNDDKVLIFGRTIPLNNVKQECPFLLQEGHVFS